MTTKPSFYNGWTEPESPATEENPPEYTYNHVIQTPRGHSFEMDDTPGRERVRLSQRSLEDGTPGSFIEMHPNGDMVQKIMGDGYEITTKDKNVLIEGMCNITIKGDAKITIEGDKIEEIFGDLIQNIRGNYFQSIGGVTKISGKSDMEITGGNQLSQTGTLKLRSAGTVYVKSDLHVDGEVYAEKITSATRIDAGSGISAGKDGFVSMLGGLSIGIPKANPGSILVSGLAGTPGLVFSTGSVVAGVQMNSPNATFGIMTAVLMTDTTNKNIFNMHSHPTPHGASGPPFVPMV